MVNCVMPSAKADKRLRRSNSACRPDVPALYGALAGRRASKGVFITTSTFTQHAVEFVQSVERIVLIDSARLNSHSTVLISSSSVGAMPSCSPSRLDSAKVASRSA